MAPFSDVMILLLAAGKSTRFGPDDKLLADFQGTKLVLHAARACEQLKGAHRIAITSNPVLQGMLDGTFKTHPATRATHGMGDNIAAGARLAMTAKVQKMLVVLGDMPLVSGRMLQDLAELCSADLPSACCDGERIVPPACFPGVMFGQLAQLAGDIGARTLLQDLPDEQLLRVSPASLCDIDRISDLAVV